MDETKNIESTEEPTLITFNEREYKSSELTDEQRDIALKLSATAKQLNSLQDAYDSFVCLSDYKNILIKGFEQSMITNEEAADSETETN